MRPDAASPVTLDTRLGWWRDAGLISAEQAAAIAAHERSWAAARPDPRPAPVSRRRWPLVVEALGYIGGALAISGAVLLVSRSWGSFGLSARLGLGVAVSIVLMVGGALVREHDDPALQRLRWSLWLLSSVSAGATAALVMIDGFDVDEARSVATVVAAVVALQNGLLWTDHQRPVQQLLFLGALPVVVGAGVSHWLDTMPTGWCVTVVGSVLVWLGLARRTVLPVVTLAIGATTGVVGVAMTVDWNVGIGLLAVVAVASGYAWLALSPHSLVDDSQRVVLLVVAAMAGVQAFPQMLAYWSQDAALVTGTAVAAVGVLLVDRAHRRETRLPVVVLLAGGAAIVGGVALVGRQSVTIATVAGLVAAVALLTLGARPGWVVLSLFGAVGLLVNVPWAIWWFFPGEGRAPLLTSVAGVLVIGVAVLLARSRSRLLAELGGVGSDPGDAGVAQGADTGGTAVDHLTGS